VSFIQDCFEIVHINLFHRKERKRICMAANAVKKMIDCYNILPIRTHCRTSLVLLLHYYATSFSLFSCFHITTTKPFSPKICMAANAVKKMINCYNILPIRTHCRTSLVLLLHYYATSFSLFSCFHITTTKPFSPKQVGAGSF
jgi:hypothetical protein